jgi:hypothetical protein
LRICAKKNFSSFFDETYHVEGVVVMEGSGVGGGVGEMRARANTPTTPPPHKGLETLLLVNVDNFVFLSL